MEFSRRLANKDAIGEDVIQANIISHSLAAIRLSRVGNYAQEVGLIDEEGTRVQMSLCLAEFEDLDNSCDTNKYLSLPIVKMVCF